MKTLREVKIGETAKVVKLHGEGPVKRRIMDMGITKGVEVYVRKVYFGEQRNEEREKISDTHPKLYRKELRDKTNQRSVLHSRFSGLKVTVSGR